MQEASYKTHDTCIGKHCKIWMMWIWTKHYNIAPGRVSLWPITLTLWSILSWKDSMDCRGSLDWHFPALGSSNPQFNSETTVGRQISLTLLWLASSPSIPNISQLCLCCKKTPQSGFQGILMNQYISETQGGYAARWTHGVAHQPFTASIHTVHTQCAGHDRWTILLRANVSQHDIVATTLLITENQSSLHFFWKISNSDLGALRQCNKYVQHSCLCFIDFGSFDSVLVSFCVCKQWKKYLHKHIL